MSREDRIAFDNQCMADEIYALTLALENVLEAAHFHGGGTVLGNRDKLLEIIRITEEALKDE